MNVHNTQKHETAAIAELWRRKLQQREDNGQRRRLRLPLRVDFSSNDYLGMARDYWPENEPRPAVTENAFTSLVNQFAALNADTTRAQHGSTGSRLLSGQSSMVSALEQAIAEFHQTEAALLFNSGFDANLGALAAIGDRRTVFLYDDLCHASLIDGMRLSLSPSVYKFRHNDLTHLRELLERYAGKTIVIVVESIYSMDGDCAPLRELTELARQYRSALVVDEAHSTAVFGEHGQGLTQQLGLQNDVTIRIHTYGKGMGCHGAAVVGSQTLIDYLINFARPFIYSTALPPSGYAAIARAYAQLANHQLVRERLQQRIESFAQQRQHHDWHRVGVRWLDSTSAIQGLVVGDVIRTRAIAQALNAAELDVRPIFAPTVPAGSERLRICLHAFNTDAEIECLLSTLWHSLQESSS